MTHPIHVGDHVNITIRNAIVCDLGDPEDDPGQALISATYERTGTADVDYVSVNPTSDAVTIQPATSDRRCRRCGATSGLRLLPGNPLTLAPREWECRDGCAGGAA